MEIRCIVFVNGNPGRQVEIARAVARTAEKEQDATLVVKYLYIFERGIHHIKTAVFIDGHTLGSRETTDLIAVETDCTEELAIGREFLDHEVKGIGNENIAGGADGQVGWFEEITFRTDGFDHPARIAIQDEQLLFIQVDHVQPLPINGYVNRFLKNIRTAV
ncbi:MAG: hypothetical protein WCE56_21115, partial [Desulfobacterales bacterium]